MNESSNQVPNLDKAIQNYNHGIITLGEFIYQFFGYLEWHIINDQLNEIHPFIKYLRLNSFVDWPNYRCQKLWWAIIISIFKTCNLNAGLPERLTLEQEDELKKAITPILKSRAIYKVITPLNASVIVRISAPNTSCYKKTIDVDKILQIRNDLLPCEHFVCCNMYESRYVENILIEEEDQALPEYKRYYLEIEPKEFINNCKEIFLD